jgi:hypothetical protein
MASGEQQLVRNLLAEATQIYGKDVYYLPLQRTHYDAIYNQDDLHEYNKAIAIEMYIESYDAFKGDGTFLGKFNLEVRDQLIFSVVKKRFEDTIENQFDIDRPREGDIIYFPLVKRMYRITYVDYKPTMYALDDLPQYVITTELIEYSGEVFNTGIKDIDLIVPRMSLDLLENGLYNESGDILMNENGDFLIYEDPIDVIDNKQYVISDNEDFQTESDNIVDFTDMNPLIDRTY